MASWRRATLQILVLNFLLLLTKSIFTEAAVSKSSSRNIVGRCIEKEREALVEFKTSLKDPSGYLSSWVGQDCCNWTFVSCNNKTGNVLRLDLAWLNLCISTPPNKSCGELGGTLNPSLLNLTYLSYLDLNGNNFSGLPIPEFIGSLKNLRYLDLSRASFNGKVPPSIGNLSNLEHLDLSMYSFQWKLWASDLNWLSGLSSLKYLGLNNVNLSTVASNWFQVVSMLPPLTELHMSSCELNSLPESLVLNFSSLEVIDLAYNKFNSSIPPWLFNIRTLTKIYLNSCELKGSIPKTSRGNLCNLQTLYLSNNAINGEINEFIEALAGCGNNTIDYIDMGSNNLRGNLPDSLGSLRYLEYLRLEQNSLSGSLPMSMGNLSSLEALDLSFNSMNGTIPESIGQLSRLYQLDLHGNSWEGMLPNSVGFYLGARVDLGFNLLEGSIPIWPNVTYLSLRNNLFSGPIPSNIGKRMSKMVNLDLSRNFLNGSIPASINNMTSLRFLDLSSNDLSGLIPKQLQGLQRLMVLDLSKNNLSGGVPSSLCPLRSLIFLKLSDNLFFLSYLGLRANLLTGTIPEQLCKFPNLHIIDLAQNNLSGAIPKCLGYLEAFTYLGPYVGELPMIQRISFSQRVEIVTKGRTNEYTKIIPLVNAIDLSSNNLVGEIPDHLTKLSALAAHRQVTKMEKIKMKTRMVMMKTDMTSYGST
ncbi:Leucine-rich repeat, typical subtype [Corchorus olitorius]|uniref:Leucine-rich repeat, typical subtype n=1 Tax=Corchorus olitorius TaxID=93759 RepID=A0A1R3J009_9ROSI|nr:Leucine-rich repeat, typical subtype [Corchorus olitorius]